MISIEEYFGVHSGNSGITDAIEVTDEIFFQTINDDGIWSLINDIVVKQPFPAPTIAELKQSKRAEINRAFEQAMQQISSGYPATEVSSWGKQETEARAYVANNSAATPLIDALPATATAENIAAIVW